MGCSVNGADELKLDFLSWSMDSTLAPAMPTTSAADTIDAAIKNVTRMPRATASGGATAESDAADASANAGRSVLRRVSRTSSAAVPKTSAEEPIACGSRRCLFIEAPRTA